MLNCYCREHLIVYAFCGTDITDGAQHATFTCCRCPGASIEQWEILFIIQYLNFILVDNEVRCGNNFAETIFKFLHSIMFTQTLQICKLIKAVVLNSFPHERFWQVVYIKNMRRSLQILIRQKCVSWMLQFLPYPPRLMPKEFHLLIYILHLKRTHNHTLCQVMLLHYFS